MASQLKEIVGVAVVYFDHELLCNGYLLQYRQDMVYKGNLGYIPYP